MRKLLIAVVLTSLPMASRAEAALTVTYEQSADGKAGITTFTADGSKLKVERLVKGHLTGVMIYDAARIELTIYTPDKGTYTKLTDADIKQVERSGTQGPPEVRYEKVGTRKRLSGFVCEVYRVFVGPRLRNEGCFAPWSPDVVSREEAEHYAQLKEGLQRFQVVRGENGMRAPGLPLEQKFFGVDGHSVRLTMVLKSLSHRSVPASTFQLPATAKPESGAPRTASSSPP